jgi:hypothetical protein
MALALGHGRQEVIITEHAQQLIQEEGHLDDLNHTKDATSTLSRASGASCKHPATTSLHRGIATTFITTIVKKRTT